MTGGKRRRGSFFNLLAFGDIGPGDTAPLPALGIPPTDESHIKTSLIPADTLQPLLTGLKFSFKLPADFSGAASSSQRS
jgi:hypothetical protein